MNRSIRAFVICLAACAAFAATPKQNTPDQNMMRAKQALANQPLRFEANQGQWAIDADFVGRADGYKVLLSGSGAKFDFGQERSIRLSFEGGNAAAQAQGVDRMALRTNYFIGRQRDQWHGDIANYARVRYSQVYPGIDLVYYGNRKQVEYDFVMRPGADPSAIRMKFTNAQKVSINAAGDLVLDTPDGQIVQKRPVIYQDEPGHKPVEGRYVMLSADTAGLKIANYDRSKGLVIDPLVLLGSYLGGSQADEITAVQLDPTGQYLYMCGYTNTSDLPATYNAYQVSSAGLIDMFLGIIDTQQYQLQYLTYLGGSNNDEPLAMVVDANEVAWMTGTTTSTDFPVLGNSIQTTGAATVVSSFVVAINPNLGAAGLGYATYLGGTTGDTTGNAIALDSQGYIYVVGTTATTDFPVTGGAYASVLYGPQDAFLAVINPNDPSDVPVYSTYYGAEDLDFGVGIGLAKDGKVYMALNTDGYQLPLAGNSYSTNNAGYTDIAVALFDITQQGTNSLVYSSYIGGSQNDLAKAAAMDPNGNFLITGYTLSPDFPVTGDSVQPGYSGNGDAVVLAVNAEKGSFLVYSSYLGGSDGEVGYGIASDSNGLIYVTGYTMSNNFPVTSDALQPAWGQGIDAFYSIIKRGVSGRSGLTESTYLGGASIMVGLTLTVDQNGIMYLGGYAENILPFFTANAFQGVYAGGFSDGFVMAIINQ